MQQTSRIALVFTVLVPLVAMLPFVRSAIEWVRYSSLAQAGVLEASALGFDWVTWEEEDGVITAGYVLPRGPAWEAGVRKGDVFFELDYQQYFNAEDLRHAIEGIAPGSLATYSLLRGDEIIEVADIPYTISGKKTETQP